MGQDAFMKKFQDRILPALRSFDPDLILLSAGFDAGKNDVGNARHTPRYQTGMDLQPAYVVVFEREAREYHLHHSLTHLPTHPLNRTQVLCLHD